MLRRPLLATTLAAPMLLPAAARAQGFPTRAIRIVSPFSPGGTSDGVVRLLSPALERVLGLRMQDQGPADVQAFVTREVERWAPIVRASGATPT